MGKQAQVTSKIESGKGNAVTLADFLADNSLFDQLSAVDQVTANLVLKSIESAKHEASMQTLAKIKADADAKAKADADAKAKADADEKVRQESMAFFTRHGLLTTSIRSAVQSALNSIIPALPVLRKVDGRVIPGIQGLCPYVPTDEQFGRRSVLSYQLNKNCFIRISMDIENGQISYAKRGRQAKQK